ncbi:MAG: glycosyltransferase, partial [Candidatus Omnitrophica bacterium]|nr:glycosyltransferase [Candidatus Omnitrophota bacterium]
MKKKVLQYKERRKQKGYAYNEHPLISFIVQSFNHRETVERIVRALRFAGEHEIIVCEDGSIDGSFQQWIKYLDRPNDFLIHSNDIHELRSGDRAARMARGEFICLLQDDSVPPENDAWVRQAIELFREFPDLVALGGRAGCQYYKESPKIYQPNHITKGGIPFMFASWTLVDPMFLRKKEFFEIGGLNLNYSPAGKPAIEYDLDLSLRAWVAGFKVGFYHPPFKRRVGGSGGNLF